METLACSKTTRQELRYRILRKSDQRFIGWHWVWHKGTGGRMSRSFCLLRNKAYFLLLSRACLTRKLLYFHGLSQVLRNMHKFTYVKETTPRPWHAKGHWSPPWHRIGPSLIPDQSIWHLWCLGLSFVWDFLRTIQRCIVSIVPLMLHSHSFITTQNNSRN